LLHRRILYCLQLGLVNFGLRLSGLLLVTIDDIGGQKTGKLCERVAGNIIAGLKEDFRVTEDVRFLGNLIQQKGVTDAVIRNDVEVGLDAGGQWFNAEIAGRDFGSLKVPEFLVTDKYFGDFLFFGEDQESGLENAGMDRYCAFQSDFDGARFLRDRRWSGCGLGCVDA
jgi:hypothetical protein